MLVLGSVGRFVQLVVTGKLRLSARRLGCTYRVSDGRPYRVFRETVRLDQPSACVIEVGFRLRLIRAAPRPHRMFQRACILTTPFWSGFDGMATKLWMVEPRDRSYAGIYGWASEGTARAYLSVLLPVLHAVSVPGSVFSEVHPECELDRFLQQRAEGGSEQTACPSGAHPPAHR